MLKHDIQLYREQLKINAFEKTAKKVEIVPNSSTRERSFC